MPSGSLAPNHIPLSAFLPRIPKTTGGLRRSHFTCLPDPSSNTQPSPSPTPVLPTIRNTALCAKGDRDRVKKSVASFGRDSVSAGPSGVPYLFLHFPEGDTLNRDTLASSLEFAKREVGDWTVSGQVGSSLLASPNRCIGGRMPRSCWCSPLLKVLLCACNPCERFVCCSITTSRHASPSVQPVSFREGCSCC